MGKKNQTYLLIYALGIGLLPLVLTNSYHLMVLNIAALNIIVVIGLTLLLGYAGQISLGHAGFFAIGGYTSALLTTHDFSRFQTAAWAAWLYLGTPGLR